MTSKLRLPDVTLVSATSVNIEETHAAMLHCVDAVDFGEVKLLCSAMPAKTDSRLQYIRIPSMDFGGYSRFILERLDTHVHTRHCLIVQSDGFIVDARRWSDDFLSYDYVGAPWPEYVPVIPSGRLNLDKNPVGNGGFSLRSKKLLEVTSRLTYDTLNFPIMSEDLIICHYLYESMVASGIKFAPAELAARFSIESPARLYGQSFDTVFGFHGKHWLPSYRARTTRDPQYYPGQLPYRLNVGMGDFRRGGSTSSDPNT